MTLTSKPLALLGLFISFNAFALVDYSEPVNEDKSMPTNRMQAKTPPMAQRSEAGRSSLIWKSDLSFTTNYESVEIDAQKIGVLNFNTHVQTPFNVYFDLTYWQAQEKRGSQSGNPKMMLGFNWLRFGSPAEEARFDIFGGAKFAGSSELASSRTDKIFGVETTKRFGTFGLGIGYDMTMTGNPKKQEDMSIGNIHHIVVSGGWMVSNDIQFELELENYKVGQASDTSKPNYLHKSFNFACLSPKMNLTIVPAVNLELGARFRTNRPKTDEDIASAKLFDLHGVYSNSLFAGLNFNI